MPDFFKFCPACKSHLFGEKEEKFFHCNSCGFVFYQNVASACALIIEFDNKILFTIRKYDPEKGTLDLPGGFVDINESAEEAVKREVKEELNLDISGMNYIASYPNQYYYKNINYHTLDFIFTTKIDFLEGIRVDDDVQGYCLLEPLEVDLGKIGMTSIRKAVQNFIGGLK